MEHYDTSAGSEQARKSVRQVCTSRQLCARTSDLSHRQHQHLPCPSMDSRAQALIEPTAVLKVSLTRHLLPTLGGVCVCMVLVQILIWRYSETQQCMSANKKGLDGGSSHHPPVDVRAFRPFISDARLYKALLHWRPKGLVLGDSLPSLFPRDRLTACILQWLVPTARLSGLPRDHSLARTV